MLSSQGKNAPSNPISSLFSAFSSVSRLVDLLELRLCFSFTRPGTPRNKIPPHDPNIATRAACYRIEKRGNAENGWGGCWEECWEKSGCWRGCWRGCCEGGFLWKGMRSSTLASTSNYPRTLPSTLPSHFLRFPLSLFCSRPPGLWPQHRRTSTTTSSTSPDKPSAEKKLGDWTSPPLHLSGPIRDSCESRIFSRGPGNSSKIQVNSEGALSEGAFWALPKSETTIKIKFAFFRGVGRGSERKIVQNAIFRGKRHDNNILKVKILLSRNFVVMAQAPIFSANRFSLQKTLFFVNRPSRKWTAARTAHESREFQCESERRLDSRESGQVLQK